MASIPGSTVEDLEARLKVDVLAEARACGGRILVHREQQAIERVQPLGITAVAPGLDMRRAQQRRRGHATQRAAALPVFQQRVAKSPLEHYAP